LEEQSKLHALLGRDPITFSGNAHAILQRRKPFVRNRRTTMGDYQMAAFRNAGLFRVLAFRRRKKAS